MWIVKTIHWTVTLDMILGNDFLDLFHVMLAICHLVAPFDILETKSDLHSFVKEYDLVVFLNAI